jgi:hypothetical protein
LELRRGEPAAVGHGLRLEGDAVNRELDLVHATHRCGVGGDLYRTGGEMAAGQWSIEPCLRGGRCSGQADGDRAQEEHHGQPQAKGSVACEPQRRAHGQS